MELPCWRYSNPCSFRAVQIWVTLPPLIFLHAFIHSSSLTRRLGVPRNTPVVGWTSHRHSSPLKLVGAFSKIITSIGEYRRDVGQDVVHQFRVVERLPARRTHLPLDPVRLRRGQPERDRDGHLGLVQVGHV